MDLNPALQILRHVTSLTNANWRRCLGFTEIGVGLSGAWPHLEGARRGEERDALIHTIGNLTLLTSRLNSKVSNGPWLGDAGKRQGLETHDVLLLNRELLKSAGDSWSDAGILSRSAELAISITEIWPVPDGHHSGFATQKIRASHRLDLSDLLSAGCIHAGTSLFPRRKGFEELTATLLPDGRIDVNGTIYLSPSEAAKAITGVSTNGWWFFLVDQQPRRSLRDLRKDYLESIAAEDGEEDSEDEDDDS